MAFTVRADFIDVFKIGDNINYNLKVLKTLYFSYENLPEGSNLIKPIVIINVSIAEALLHDFIINRIKWANRTEVILAEVGAIFQNKTFDKFEHYITQAEKHDFFQLADTNFYTVMHDLRKKRNRIHIQNVKRELPVDEEEVFNERVKKQSEKVIEKIVNTLNEKYPRRPEYRNYVADFHFPWTSHYTI